MSQYPKHLTKLIEFLKKFPGVGQKSAERYAFQILKWPQSTQADFARVLEEIPRNIDFCKECHAMSSPGQCLYCGNSNRDLQQLCVVGHTKDVFAIEDSHSFHGLYHVLGGLLSPSNGFESDQLNINDLIARIKRLGIQEVILAFDSTVEGDATSLFLKKKISELNINVSRLAFGIPVGSALDYIDSSTLSRAFAGRQGF